MRHLGSSVAFHIQGIGYEAVDAKGNEKMIL